MGIALTERGGMDNMNIEYELIETYGVFDETESGWTREVNLISWNGKEPKIDVRTWSPDHSKSSKIGTLSKDSARRLAEILMRATE